MNSSFKSALEEFYNENKNSLMNKEEIISISKKTFTTSDFSGFNKERLQKIYNEENIIFGFPEGILFTNENLYVFNISLGATRLHTFRNSDFLTIEATHKTFSAYGRISINRIEVKKEGTTKFNIELYSKLKEKIKNKEIEFQESKLVTKFEKVDKLFEQLQEIEMVKIIEVTDYKKTIIENQNQIVKNGGDDKLFSFMKVDTFLKDFRNRILNDKDELKDILNVDWLKNRIREESNRKDLDKVIENLEDMSAKLEGRRTKGFESNVDKLFEMGELMKPSFENQIVTLEYYRNMALAMLVFYINDNKIRYFEIYEAFEKLGVFDSTWQKNVLNKLDSIEIRLAQISNQLTELNQNFISLVESSENVVSELKEINSGIMTNNLLQAITAYQTWRINKNTKSLRE